MFRFTFNRFRLTMAFMALVVLCIVPMAATTLAQDATVSASMTKDGIPTLVGTNGNTLYTFAPDQGAGVSTCYDECAQEWPPLTIAAGEQPVVTDGIPGVVA